MTVLAVLYKTGKTVLAVLYTCKTGKTRGRVPLLDPREGGCARATAGARRGVGGGGVALGTLASNPLLEPYFLSRVGGRALSVPPSPSSPRVTERRASRTSTTT